MRRTRFGILTSAAVIVLLAGGNAVANAAPAPVAAPATSSVVWGTCADPGFTEAGLQCAMLSVPLDYDHPNGTKIQLALSRAKHSVPAAQYQGVMLVNPGGPGGSGLGLSTLGQYVPKNAGAAYDWIGFDPRGVGSSVPALSCDPNYFGYNRPSYIPLLPSTLNAWLTRSAGYAKACAKNGPILQHMTTIDTARDMDSIRAALGVQQINYYGFSYGTYLGQVYGTLFPERVRRQVLDSNVDPRGVWYQDNLDQDVAFQKNMEIWWAWLAKYDNVYHLGNTELKVQTLFYAIEAKLTLHADDGKLGGDEWVDAFLYAGYYQQTWLNLGQLFSDYVHKGDSAAVEDQYASAQGLGDDNGFAVYAAVQCTDTQWPTKWSTWAKDNWTTFAKAPYETWSNAWFNAPCLYWPAPAHQPVKIDGSKVKSTLLIDETLDAATPYTGSLEVRKLFGRYVARQFPVRRRVPG
jgi:pimeloyl-ACP methyl ester carboxylesterase